VHEAHFFGDGAVFLKFLRGDVFDDGQMISGGLKVLAEGEDVAVGGAKILHGGVEFDFGFAEAKHDSGFCEHAIGGAGFDFGENGQGSIVGGAGTDVGGEAANGFEVVVENFGLGFDHDIESGVVVVEIGNEDFDNDAGIELAHGLDGFAEMISAAVFQIIARDGGDDDVIEFHAAGGFGDAHRFVGFEREGLGGFDGAEGAGARAVVAGDHEGGGAFAPAFPVVGAFGAFADGVEAEIVEEGAGLEIAVARGQFDAQPSGQADAIVQTVFTHETSLTYSDERSRVSNHWAKFDRFSMNWKNRTIAVRELVIRFRD
jgi:hypothetical protein